MVNIAVLGYGTVGSDIIECINLKTTREINLRESRIMINKPELKVLEGTDLPILEK